MPCRLPVAEAKSQMYGEAKLVPVRRHSRPTSTTSSNIDRTRQRTSWTTKDSVVLTMKTRQWCRDDGNTLHSTNIISTRTFACSMPVHHCDHLESSLISTTIAYLVQNPTGTRVMRETGERETREDGKRDIREWRLHSSTSDYILQRSLEWTDLDI